MSGVFTNCHVLLNFGIIVQKVAWKPGAKTNRLLLIISKKCNLHSVQKPNKLFYTNNIFFNHSSQTIENLAVNFAGDHKTE